MKVKENNKGFVSAVAYSGLEMFEIEDDSLPDFGTCETVDNALECIYDFIFSSCGCRETDKMLSGLLV